MKKTLGLALGSGGSRGVAHIGFLKALEEVGVRPDYITGTSMGAVVGAGYAAGLTVEEMKEAVFRPTSTARSTMCSSKLRSISYLIYILRRECRPRHSAVSQKAL